MTMYEFIMENWSVDRLREAGLLKYTAMLYPAIYGKYLFHRKVKNKTNALRTACGEMNCCMRVGFRAVKMMEKEI